MNVSTYSLPFRRWYEHVSYVDYSQVRKEILLRLGVFVVTFHHLCACVCVCVFVLLWINC